MKTNPNDPVTRGDQAYGLTKRELFAAMAMAGMGANPEFHHLEAEQVAQESTQLADALIAALNKDTP